MCITNEIEDTLDKWQSIFLIFGFIVLTCAVPNVEKLAVSFTPPPNSICPSITSLPSCQEQMISLKMPGVGGGGVTLKTNKLIANWLQVG